MPLSRRAFLSFILAAPAFNAVAGTDTAAFRFTPQEQIVLDYFATRGLHKFLLLNEKRGQLMAVDHGRVTSWRALSGKTPGDFISEGVNVTPAGLFELTFSPDQSHHEAYIQFNRRADQTIDTIHPVIQVPGQERLKRLADSEAMRRRISGGCVNVGMEDYKFVSAFARASMQTLISGDGRSSLSASYLIVLPENIAETRQILGIPGDFPAPK